MLFSLMETSIRVAPIFIVNPKGKEISEFSDSPLETEKPFRLV